MNYESTRGGVDLVSAAETIIKGLAPDGGLYVPADKIEPIEIAKNMTEGYQNLAAYIFNLFLSDFSAAEIEDAVKAAYNSSNFDHPQITPLKNLSNKLAITELWHGPTYAFKDIALQILPHLLTKALKITGEQSEIVILTATSGDTGKSALEGFRDIPSTRIVVFFPQNGVSEIQKLQMVTQEGKNVNVTSVDGNFDDAQSGVKEIFNDREFVKQLASSGYLLSSANSINWGRLLPQIVYYFKAYQDMIRCKAVQIQEKVNFVVPTGNFGNILAGYYAFRLGLPINRLICASNSNNVLTRFIKSGLYNSNRKLNLTISPSMDILVSSNLERLLFELTEHDSNKINIWMAELKNRGTYSVDKETLNRLQKLFWGDFADDSETMATIASVYKKYNYLIDTHTAVGIKVWEKYMDITKDDSPAVILSTASPYKFAASVLKAIRGDKIEEGLSEQDKLNLLSSETATEVPVNLANLESKEIRHKQVISLSEMKKNLIDFLA